MKSVSFVPSFLVYSLSIARVNVATGVPVPGIYLSSGSFVNLPIKTKGLIMRPH